MEVIFFDSPAKLRSWLHENHDRSDELWIGFYKKGSGKPSVTYPEAVDEALCFGWIDGIRKAVDDVSYTNRFTPRKPRSNWSAVNIKRVNELMALGRMQPPGLEAFNKRTDNRSQVYSYEQRDKAAFDPAQEEQFRASEPAWTFFQSQPPGYRRTATWWVLSAKQEATRQKRLATLIELSEKGKRLPQFDRTTTT
jgi:uncharacterized protein YdeI (YjbR/CyaY-like superfamily)